MKRELKASDIARRHGVDRKTAYRWMIQIERECGPAVIGRRGKKRVLVTTEDAFAKVAPLVGAVEERRFRELEERMADAECRADKHAADIIVLQRGVAKLTESNSRPK